MKNILCTSLLIIAFQFFQSESSFAQQAKDNPKFDSTFQEIATSVSGQDISLAIKMADSLYAASAKGLQEIKSLMLLATLQKRVGNYTVALDYAVRAEEMAAKERNRDWQVRISGFLSTTFREAGLFTEGKKFLDIAEKSNNETGASPLIRMFIHQEKAYYQMDKKRWADAIEEIKKAEGLSGAGGNKNFLFQATNYQVMGYCYLKLGQYDHAMKYLAQAWVVIGDQETELKGFIYQNIGSLYLLEGKNDSAIRYLDSALAYTRASDNFSLKRETFERLYEYYLSIGDKEKALSYQQQYTKLTNDYIKLSNDISNMLISKYDLGIKKKANQNGYLIVICIALLILIILVIGYSRKTVRKERERYLAYIEKFRNQKMMSGTEAGEETVAAERTHEQNDNKEVQENNVMEAQQVHQPVVTENEDDTAIHQANEHFPEIKVSEVLKKESHAFISQETEERVLKELAKQEQRQFFLRNDINLSYLSLKLKVNTKYLSYIINKHKEKDFNNYINELRINYIIEKLQHKPEYLDYKISYLAQECGFSSHSKFTTVFKTITGISPSVFIANIKLDHKGHRIS